MTYKCKICGYENDEWYCKRCDDGTKKVKRNYKRKLK